MNNKGFECKDCGSVYETAKEFVDHIPTCENNYDPNASLQLQNAAILLRRLIHSANYLANQDAVYKTRHAKGVKKDISTAYNWLVVNKLQGSLIKP